MCGIVGVREEWLRSEGLEPEAALQAALEELRWRGPDEVGIQRAGGWWLGCARLAISGPGRPQPVVRRGGRYVGVMNGAVTNARELWAKFAPGIERRAMPPNDAWLPLLAVEAGDYEALEELRGHHAYAVVDTQTDKVVYGVDRYREKPLVALSASIGEEWGLVAFASTTRALSKLGYRAPKRVAASQSWFRFGWHAEDQARSGMVPSPPRRGTPNLDAPVRPALPKSRRRRAARADEGDLREHLEGSLRRCLDTPAHAGLFLSGGVDSSCLALSLARIDRSIPAYQFRAAGAPPQERDAAREVARAADLPLHEIDGGPEVLDALPRLTGHAGTPLGDPSILAVHAVGRAAAADGVRVMLGGEGADELLLGYRRYQLLARLPRLRSLAKLPHSSWSMSTLARAWRAMVGRDPVRSLLAVTPPAFGHEVLSEALVEPGFWSDADPFETDGGSLALAGRDYDLQNYLPCDLLPKLDVALMAAGVEGRCPYLEAGIESFGERLDALGKRPLRRAFQDELPRSVQTLPKRGFSLPLNEWFRDALPALDVLAERRSRERDHLRPGGMARAVDQHRSGRADLGHGLYLLYAYEVYLRDVEAREAPSLDSNFR